jgi:TonB family protein
MADHRLLLTLIISLGFLSSLQAQSASPARQQPVLKAIYTPKPVYQEEWARRGISGKGIVLVTVDKETGKVTGAQMLQSTGSKLLDGSALEAYSRWRFQPGTVSQVKIPIEFKNRPNTQTPNRNRTLPQPAIFLLILLAVAGAAMGILKRRSA